ncbi:type II toxin-antitoxin system VapB family antitoxin [Chelatococcus sambhunathii]|uniref:Type II toxin-antitoxin system VapB family antitoxin n=1 Tax=Chelatococcus sambhunathii TaxID=363953 RepID=A0ABU1DHA5_9HYPH|nr:type II toxin-antitoxin system VapB family antitoxin [Chelatococcus sambhunathii]MDR4307503.1 type II toxin-antitoxin system VapB family antitoxin [Chelatococcus sambhunathii]
MAFHVRDPETDRIVRQLAATKGTSITEAIRAACDEALKNAAKTMTKEERHARMRAIREELARLPQDDSVVIDKAFFDALYED